MWKRAIRAFKFSQSASALRTGLFSFVPPLRLAIAEIRRECVNVEQRRLFAVGQGETITLEAFLERQRTKQQEVAQVCGFASDDFAETDLVFVCRNAFGAGEHTCW